MAFASIHIPGFLIQALIRTDPTLRQRAIALVDGTPPLWKVIAANERALRAGIQVGNRNARKRHGTAVAGNCGQGVGHRAVGEVDRYARRRAAQIHGVIR